MIEFQADGFPTFLIAFGVFHHAGVEVTASGGNRASVPDDTNWDLVRRVAAIPGVTVWTNLPAPGTAADGPVDVPAKTRRAKKES